MYYVSLFRLLLIYKVPVARHARHVVNDRTFNVRILCSPAVFTEGCWWTDV